jgi:uncharacterized protein
MLVKIDAESGIPLIGALQFGIVIRGSNNMVQVRPTTVCNIKCTFCSTCANDFNVHPHNFEVDVDYLVKWFEHVAEFKGRSIEANIDSVGEPMAYPSIVDLISKLSKSKWCSFVSMQTNGTFLSDSKVNELIEAGLGRINLSLHSLDSDMAKKLSGSSNFEVDVLVKAVKYASKRSLEVNLTPVLVPSVNENDVKELVKFAKNLGIKISIQKYEAYRNSRKVSGVKPTSYFKFYKLLKEWEKELKVRLCLSKRDFNIESASKMDLSFTTGERVKVKLVSFGWYKDEMIGVAKNRCVTVRDCKNKVGDNVNVRITDNKNHIYLAKMA